MSIAGVAASAVLAGFRPATRRWFANVFAEPTPAQAGAWQAIAARQHSLVIAPTGSGKTLAAFLAALDRLTDPALDHPPDLVHTLYISPLKALGVDVERNLRAPLRGIAATAEQAGEPVREVSVGVRSGDTPAGERRRLVAHPPDILITTPESLNLLLTSAAASILAAVDTVIVDEVHALAGGKRGAHLAVSLERLDALRAAAGEQTRPALRVGLSATVRPPERVAEFLAGAQPVHIVAPPSVKEWQLEVRVPVEDMSNIGATASPTDASAPGGEPRTPSIWPHVEAEIVDVIEQHHSTLVFANSRRLAERLTSHLNDLHAERSQAESSPESGDSQAASSQPSAPPAQVMAQAGASGGHDGTEGPALARAHHGSVSKEQRALIESDLKAGRLPCVVATSSLELGIDMGAVDVVVQVESPPSVASGLQRVGRAGHQVGAVSRGVFFPNHRGDLLETAVVVERMRQGLIEEVPTLRNPLDVLAQQIVATVARPPGAEPDQGIGVEDLLTLMRRAQPFTDLPASAFEAVLDMLSGRYPSEEFAELRPRLIWDRTTGVLTARPGAQRLAVTSGGTIPDRGLFGVFLAGSEETGRRVGELDEEMVYESRVGDVFTLGTTSWRIEQITHDRVLVTPAPGVPGKLPFWKGDSPGRPAELGRAVGSFVRDMAALEPAQAVQRLVSSGLDERAARNLHTYLREQAEATGRLPSDTLIVVERFRDELGDWRVCVHSPLGSSVLSPWALAIEHRARERYGLEVQATATNDGIVLRVPDTDAAPPGADLIVFEPEEIEALITEEVGGSALFASRFRECAARALLLPRRDPRSRSPLWQQRMRAAQLLQVASRYPEFPIILETMRECLDDVFDLGELLVLQRAIADRSVQIVEVETGSASPFAASLLFGYVGAFVYEGDMPLAEKKAAALSLDAGLLAELLGREGLSQLLDADVIVALEAQLQGFGDRAPVGSEQVFDLLRTAGPFSTAELVERVTSGSAEDPIDVEVVLAELAARRRIAALRITGVDRWAATEDLALFHDGLGIPSPAGYPSLPYTAELGPIESLVLRWSKTHGPFFTDTVADRYGLGRAVVSSAARHLKDDKLLTRGAFTGDDPAEYCAVSVLAVIKRRTLAKLRREVEPVEQVQFARFLGDWQSVTPSLRHRGVDGLLAAVDSISGYPLPASMLEPLVLSARVRDYRPDMLDELLAAGEITWSGSGALGETDGWIRLWSTEPGPPPGVAPPESALSRSLLAKLTTGGAWRFDDLIDDSGSRGSWRDALWELVWSGYVTNDTYAGVRQRVGAGLTRRRAPARGRPMRRSLVSGPRGSRPRSAAPVARGPENQGRWSAVTGTPDRFTGEVLTQLERYGVLTRGSVTTEAAEGGFGPTYRALASMEDEGVCRRGYFIEGLGAAQFALPGAVDRLRTESQPGVLMLAACDPANPYGAALPWPERSGHRPARKAGALVVLENGALTLYVERGGRSLLTFSEGSALTAACIALATAVQDGHLGSTTIERANGEHVFDSGLRPHLEEAGFTMTPKGLRIRR